MMLAQSCREIRIEKLRIGIQKAISHHVMRLLESEGPDLQVFVDQMAHAVVCDIRGFVLKMAEQKELKRTKTAEQSVIYPRDWWQAFRQRWAPKWWLDRYPVQMTTVTIATQTDVVEKHETRICPHTRVPDNRPHFHYLATGETLDARDF